MTKREYLHPLHGFTSNVDYYELTVWMRIVSTAHVNLDDYLIDNPFLSIDQVDHIARCSHFLIIEWDNIHINSKKDLSRYLNIFQVILKIKISNKILILNRLYGRTNVQTFYDNLGLYNPLDYEVCNYINNSDLILVKDLFDKTILMLGNSIKINSAFHFSYIAMTMYHWDSAYVNYIASLEALFCNKLKNETTGSGIVKSISAIFAKSQEEYDKYTEKYESIYRTRNRILHGSYDPEIPSKDNWEKLLLLEKLVRRLWLEIIVDIKLQDNLSMSINKKTKWLNGIIYQFDKIGKKENSK